MKKIFICICLILSSIQAEVKIETILETTQIKEYNNWIKNTESINFGINPIYIKFYLIKDIGSTIERKKYDPERSLNPSPTNPYTRKYKISYFNEDGRLNKEEEIMGYVAVKLSLNFDEVLIIQKDHPINPEKTVTTIKDRNGNVVFSSNNIFSINFTGCGLYWEDIDVENFKTDIKLFNKNGNEINHLNNVWIPYHLMPPVSLDKKFLVEGFMPPFQNDSDPSQLVFLSNEGMIIWKKEFSVPKSSVSPIGLYPSISGDGNVISIGHLNKIYVYKKNGETWREYTNDYSFPSLSSLTQDGKFLIVATRESGTKLSFYNNETGALLWWKKVKDNPITMSLFSISISPDGNYIALVTRPNILYFFNNKGEILKRIELNYKKYYSLNNSHKEDLLVITKFFNNYFSVIYTIGNVDYGPDFYYQIFKINQ